MELILETGGSDEIDPQSRNKEDVSCSIRSLERSC